MTPGSSRETAIDRPTARVLLFDEHDRTLLFTAMTPDEDTGLPFWFPPGGGVEPGETHEEAAVRELMEETGLAAPLERHLWNRTWTGTLQGRWYTAHEQYYFARCIEPRITVDRWTDLEIQTIKECRWWSVADINAANGVSAIFVPRELPRLLPGILAGDLPVEPHWVDPDGQA